MSSLKREALLRSAFALENYFFGLFVKKKEKEIKKKKKETTHNL